MSAQGDSAYWPDKSDPLGRVHGRDKCAALERQLIMLKYLMWERARHSVATEVACRSLVHDIFGKSYDIEREESLASIKAFEADMYQRIADDAAKGSPGETVAAMFGRIRAGAEKKEKEAADMLAIIQDWCGSQATVMSHGQLQATMAANQQQSNTATQLGISAKSLAQYNANLRAQNDFVAESQFQANVPIQSALQGSNQAHINAQNSLNQDCAPAGFRRVPGYERVFGPQIDEAAFKAKSNGGAP